MVIEEFRLIPAWAGKTAVRVRERIGRRAHPRVGGENCAITRARAIVEGSSPRGRGKRCGQHARSRIRRLIPAWAGKTRSLEERA